MRGGGSCEKPEEGGRLVKRTLKEFYYINFGEASEGDKKRSL